MCGQLPLPGRTVERLFGAQAQTERKSGFRGKEKRESEASNRVACGRVSVHEMWKRKQIHEDASKMYRTKIPEKKIGKMVKTTFGRP